MTRTRTCARDIDGVYPEQDRPLRCWNGEWVCGVLMGKALRDGAEQSSSRIPDSERRALGEDVVLEPCSEERNTMLVVRSVDEAHEA